MNDPDLIAKKLAFIETCVRELRDLARPGEVDRDVRERRFVEHTPQVAVQAAMDVASHIVSDRRLGEPSTNRELFDLIAGDGWIDGEQVGDLRDMVGFRNIIVHGYRIVDPGVLKDIIENHLDDLHAFGKAIHQRLGAS